MQASETNAHHLLQGTKVFLVPNFQRRYAWRKQEWQDLWDDILDELGREHPEADSRMPQGHFLGSVVLHPAPGPASTVTRYLVIDGQQRLTTLLVLIAALRDVREAVDPDFDNAEYDSQYLTNPFHNANPDRLVPTSFDQEAYTQTVRHRAPTGGIGQAYTWFEERIKQLVHEHADPPGLLSALGDTILLHLVFVEITTSPSDSINSIFNTLNSKGLPLTAADLIRNEFLLNLDQPNANEAYEKYWLPMEKALVRETNRGIDNSQLINYFWARELQHTPNLPLKNLFPQFERRLKSLLKNESSERRQQLVLMELQRLHAQHDIYKAISTPQHTYGHAALITADLREKLEIMQRWGSSPHIPVTFTIIAAFIEGKASEQEASSAIHSLLSYLIRRSIAGYATNNLNRLLSAVPAALTATSEPVDTAILRLLSRRGYHWPTTSELLTSIESTPLYLSAKRQQVHYILSALEQRQEPYEPVDTSSLQIEHVLPQTLSAEWIEALREWGDDIEESKALTHTLGNLTLTGKNPQLSNSPYEKKTEIYQESPLKLNQTLMEHKWWTTESIRSRSRELGHLVAEIWRGPAQPSDHSEIIAQSPEEADPESYRIASAVGVKEVLNSLPEGRWTAAAELSSAVGLSEDQVEEIVLSLGPELARLVRTHEGRLPEWLTPELKSATKRQAEASGPEISGRPATASELAAFAGWTSDSGSDDK